MGIFSTDFDRPENKKIINEEIVKSIESGYIKNNIDSCIAEYIKYSIQSEIVVLIEKLRLDLLHHVKQDGEEIRKLISEKIRSIEEEALKRLLPKNAKIENEIVDITNDIERKISAARAVAQSIVKKRLVDSERLLDQGLDRALRKIKVSLEEQSTLTLQSCEAILRSKLDAWLSKDADTMIADAVRTALNLKKVELRFDTNRELAAALGISIREVKRRRKVGLV